MVNIVFKDQLGRNLEAYIDDMVIKSRTGSHELDVGETFENLRRNNMKLNPLKCAFGVKAGKFLGFMVNQRGIEANPEKIQALLDMTPPKCIKDVQKLNGRITALGRFISRSAERCLPFFKTLKGGKDKDSFKWGADCDKAFEEVKAYLGQPPLLSSPVPGEELFLFLAATDLAVAAVLVREECNSQKPVYYVSKALSAVESRYLNAEKLAYALLVAARKLRAYFSAHPITVYTDAPLKKILYRPEISGRLLAWSIELTEFQITYTPRKVIKATSIG